MREMKNKSRLVIVIIFAIVATIVIGFISYSSGSTARKLKVQLDLGHQYLNDLDYENAVTAFKEALAIAPGNKKAISGFTEANKGLSDGLVAKSEFENAILALDEARTVLPDNPDLIAMEGDIYLQWADFVFEEDNYEDAIKLLMEGYEKLGDERLKERADELQAEYDKYLSKRESIKVRARIEKTDYEGIKERNRALIKDGASCECDTYYMVFLEPVDFYISDGNYNVVSDEMITLTTSPFVGIGGKAGNGQKGFTCEEYEGKDLELYVYPYVMPFTAEHEYINDEVEIMEYDENGEPTYRLYSTPARCYVILDYDKTDELFGY